MTDNTANFLVNEDRELYLKNEEGVLIGVMKAVDQNNVNVIVRPAGTAQPELLTFHISTTENGEIKVVFALIEDEGQMKGPDLESS